MGNADARAENSQRVFTGRGVSSRAGHSHCAPYQPQTCGCGRDRERRGSRCGCIRHKGDGTAAPGAVSNTPPEGIMLFL